MRCVFFVQMIINATSNIKSFFRIFNLFAQFIFNCNHEDHSARIAVAESTEKM